MEGFVGKTKGETLQEKEIGSSSFLMDWTGSVHLRMDHVFAPYFP